MECCFQTETLQTYLRKQGSAITLSLRSATKWKPCILCSYPESKTAFRWFADTILTYCFILCYCIVEGNKYRPGGSYKKTIQSPSIWKQQFRLNRRNECTTLPDVITPLFIYHRSYKMFPRHNALKQRTSTNSFIRSDLFTFTKIWTQAWPFHFSVFWPHKCHNIQNVTECLQPISKLGFDRYVPR